MPTCAEQYSDFSFISSIVGSGYISFIAIESVMVLLYVSECCSKLRLLGLGRC